MWSPSGAWCFCSRVKLNHGSSRKQNGASHLQGHPLQGSVYLTALLVGAECRDSQCWPVCRQMGLMRGDDISLPLSHSSSCWHPGERLPLGVSSPPPLALPLNALLRRANTPDPRPICEGLSCRPNLGTLNLALNYSSQPCFCLCRLVTCRCVPVGGGASRATVFEMVVHTPVLVSRQGKHFSKCRRIVGRESGVPVFRSRALAPTLHAGRPPVPGGSSMFILSRSRSPPLAADMSRSLSRVPGAKKTLVDDLRFFYQLHHGMKLVVLGAGKTVAIVVAFVAGRVVGGPTCLA